MKQTLAILAALVATSALAAHPQPKAPHPAAAPKPRGTEVRSLSTPPAMPPLPPKPRECPDSGCNPQPTTPPPAN